MERINKMNEITTTDLSKFGNREKGMGHEELYRSLEDTLDIINEYLTIDDKLSLEEHIKKAKQALSKAGAL